MRHADSNIRCQGTIVLLLLLVFGLAGGCQSGGTATPMKVTDTSKHAVVAWGPHGMPAAVIIQPAEGNEPVPMTSNASASICDSCKTLATEYFRTGILPPTCPKCQRKLTAVTLD